MFAFAVFDRDTGALTLCRDRLGVKPLYYGWLGTGDSRSFVFASELWSIRAIGEPWLSLDRRAVTSYLRFLCVPSQLSIFEQISKLDPGSLVTVSRQGDLSTTTYWDASALAKEAASNGVACSFEEASHRTEELLEESVRLRMVADVPVGAFLSGGIDSSLIVALMRKVATGPVRTYTISFEEGAFNEGDYARQVASHLGTMHTDHRIRHEDVLGLLPELPSLFDEPFADSSAIPTLLVSGLARRDVTVALTGDGGDELFGGYHRYISARKYWNWARHPAIAGALRLLGTAAPSAASPLLGRLAGMVWPSMGSSFGTEKFQKFTRDADWRSELHLYRLFRSIWTEPEALVIGGSEAADPFPGLGRVPLNLSAIKRFMWIDTRSYLPDDLLCKVDRTSMAVSLEARDPMIDHRVVEWSWRLPDEWLYDGYRGKLMLRSILDRHIPRVLTDRRKMGFGVPIGDWMRGPLCEWASECLRADRIDRAGVLDPHGVALAWMRFRRDTTSDPNRVWALLMLQGWLETKPQARRHRWRSACDEIIKKRRAL
jgi:asparagine synthase (glutamine-hydrolysing)